MAEALGDVMQVTLFIVTLACAISIACNLFVVEMSDGLTFEILLAFVDLTIWIGLTFVYHYLSECISTDSLAVGDERYAY